MSIEEKRLKEKLFENGQLERYLISIGMTNKKGRFNCILCNCSRSDSGVILTGRKGIEKYYCHSCGNSGKKKDESSKDILNIIQEYNNCSYNEALKIGADFLGNKEYQNIKIEPRPTTKEQDRKTGQKLWAIRNSKTPLDEDTKRYLHNRGLLGVAERINQLKGLNLSIYTSISTWGGTTTKYIVYDFKTLNEDKNQGSLIRKNIAPNCLKKDKVRNTGNNKLITLNPYKNSNKYLVIEGIEDALTGLLLKDCNVISLNGVGNKNNLVQVIKNNISWCKQQEFILLLDNDKDGNESRKYLKTELEALKIPYVIPTKALNILIGEGLKDINDYLKKYRKEKFISEFKDIL